MQFTNFIKILTIIGLCSISCQSLNAKIVIELLTIPDISDFTPQLLRDIECIRELQAANLKTNLSHQMQQSDGFLNYQSTPKKLLTIAHMYGIIVARDQRCFQCCRKRSNIVGYLLPSTEEFITTLDKEEQKGAEKMFEQVKQHIEKKYGEINCCQGAQVCVAAKYRRRGIFKQMYDVFCKANIRKYRYSYSLIHTENTAAHADHTKIGFESIGEMKIGPSVYNILCLPIKK